MIRMQTGQGAPALRGRDCAQNIQELAQESHDADFPPLAEASAAPSGAGLSALGGTADMVAPDPDAAGCASARPCASPFAASRAAAAASSCSSSSVALVS